MTELSNKELLTELGVDTAPKEKTTRSPCEERIIAGFEEIQGFVEEHDRSPDHGEDKDIFERLYAVRLDQIRANAECQDLLAQVDHQGLLAEVNRVADPPPEYDDDAELLRKLGVEAPKEGDVTFLKHVKTRAEIKAAEEIATRTPCKDFKQFKPLFDTVQQELKSGRREAKLLRKNAKINQGDLFILFGQKAYVAKTSNERTYGFDKNDYRLRVIYDNGTESDLLLRSLQKALDRDEAGGRIVELTAGPLFSDTVNDEDLDSGTIYVLRSKSAHPTVAENREVIHKIGVTGGKVETRISNAKLDPTFLMADVEIVASYELYNINRSKLEGLIHKFFAQARLDIEINDRFGNPVSPKEWFLVPVFIIDEVVEKIKDSTLNNYTYDIKSACLVKAE